MTKLRSVALVFAALCIALPTLASAHDHHGGGWHGHHGGWGHARVFAPFFPVPVPVPVPVAYVPAPVPVYTAPCPPPPAYYPPAAYYPAAVSVPGPFIAVRTPHVAVSIGGIFPY